MKGTHHFVAIGALMFLMMTGQALADCVLNGKRIASRLEPITAGTDEDGEPITSCVIVPVEIDGTADVTGPRLSRNQQTMFSILHDAGDAVYRRTNGITAPVRPELAASAKPICTTSAPL